MLNGHTDKIPLLININHNVFTNFARFKHRLIKNLIRVYYTTSFVIFINQRGNVRPGDETPTII